MNRLPKTWLYSLLVLPLLLFSRAASAQCPEVYDFYGMVTESPYWYTCSGNDYTLNLQSPDNWSDYSIDWGDGSPASTGTSWISPGFIQHFYVSTVDTFNVVITELNTGCIVNGVLIMEEATSASIQIPVGGLTQACAPQVMEFINSSTNVSETTIFTWDFGDGTAPLVFDYTNWNQTISHLYDVGTVDCETEVSLTAQNYCNVVQGGPSEATFNPIRIWDLDDASISPSATLLCYPDTVVTFLNTTERNCLFQGNIYQRYEYWNFGDYWGEGQDSIIDWTPWPPTFPHTLAYPGIGTYSVTLLDSNFCGIDTVSISIQIVPPPQAGIAANPDTVCIGDPITFIQQATGNANSYSWNFGNGTGWMNTGSGNITFVYGQPGTYTVQNAVGISGAVGSCSDTASVTVVVLPSPIVNIVPDNEEGCDQLTVDYSQTSANGVSWEWTFDVAPFTYSGADPPPVDYNSTGGHTTTLQVTAANGCESEDSETVHVYQSPIAGLSVTNLCEGDTAQFSDDSIEDNDDPITSWNWDFGDGISSTSSSPDHLYTSTGSFDIVLSVETDHCSDVDTTTIIVEAAPLPDIDQDLVSDCAPVEVQFTNNTIGAVSVQWTFGDGATSTLENPTHTFNNNMDHDTTYVIVMTAYNAFGCGRSDTLYVTAMPNANAAFNDNGQLPGCSPFEANFFNTSTGADTYLWDFGDGTTSTFENPSHLYNNATGFLQSFNVTLYAYAENGCNDTVIHAVSVFPLADFDFDIWPDSGCAPVTVTMPYISGVQEFFWDFGDGTTSTFAIPTHQFSNTTTQPIVYDVTLIGVSPFGCADTASSQILVNPAPTSQFSVDVLSGCSPLDVTFTNLSLYSDYYEWNYGDGQTSTTNSLSHTHTYINETNSVQVYTIQLTAHTFDGCVHQYSYNVQVYPQVIADVNLPGPYCSPATIFFDNNSLNGQYYDWDFGNGLQANQANPSSYYVNTSDSAITYTVTVSVTSGYGCSDVFSFPVIINPEPIADFDISENSGCNPAPVWFTNNSTLATSYIWNYGDGTTSTETASIHEHTFSNSTSELQEFTITLLASTDQGCTATSVNSFTLYPDVLAAFTVDSANCSPFNAMFVNQSVGASNFEWSFGDAQMSAETNPAHIYETNNTDDVWYTAQLVAQNIYGCSDTATHDIHVYHVPVAAALIDSINGCFPMEVFFQNASVGADSYQWVYGTGQVSDTSALIHGYEYYNFGTSPITYDVVLHATTDFGCNSIDELEVEVLPNLEAEFNVNDEGCTPFAVTFDNNSSGVFSYLWDFGDGDQSNIADPEHTFFNWGTTDTTYTITLIVFNAYGCSDTADAVVTVFPEPVAGFYVDPISQVWPLSTVTIDNMTTGGELTWQWDMDDGTDYFVEEPGSHTYSTWGTYNIELFVTNGSCSDMIVQQIEILAPPPVADFIGPAEGCAPLTVQFTNLSQYYTSSYWQFGDGGAANSSNPVYTYVQPGTYTVTLTVYGYDGSSDVMIQEQIIHVYPSAIAAFTVTPSEVNVPSQPVYCLNLSQNADVFEWIFGDGGTSNVENPLHYYQDEGTYTVTLIANNEYNCPDTMTIVDAVHAVAIGMMDFPNAFTPNPQGANGGIYDPMSFNNDIFFPLHKGVEEYQLQIFNKWGELLFESKDIWRGWDGYYHDALCRQDVYVWKAKARFVDGQQLVKSGDVTLLVR